MCEDKKENDEKNDAISLNFFLYRSYSECVLRRNETSEDTETIKWRYWEEVKHAQEEVRE